MFSSLVVFSAQGRFAQKLLNDLMENYSNALRPVEDTDKALNVTLQITLSQIKDMVSTKHTHTHTSLRNIDSESGTYFIVRIKCFTE